MTRDAATDRDPAWSPDGRWIYFASNRGGGINVWRIAVGAGAGSVGGPQQLTTGAGDDVEPAPSPDGHRLAFAARVNADLWQLPVSPTTAARAGTPTPVVVSTREDSRGAWSPDGRTIAFNSDRQGEMNIWLHDVATGADRRLTIGPGGDYQPSWAPDGRTLAFFSARGGSIDIWSVAVDDGQLRRLTDDPGMDINPFFSPDGLSIAFMSERAGEDGHLGDERRWVRPAAADFIRRRGPLLPVDGGRPRHRVPGGDGDRAADHARRARGR